MKMSKSAWPVMIVSQELNLGNDNGVRLREIAAELEHVQECKVIPSFTYEDAWELFLSRADLGAVVVDWDLPFDAGEEHMTPDEFVHKMRERNKKIPILLMTDRLETENIPTGALGEINGCLWKNADTAEFIAGRIEIHLVEYIKSVFPVFFRRTGQICRGVQIRLAHSRPPRRTGLPAQSGGRRDVQIFRRKHFPRRPLHFRAGARFAARP